MSRGVDKGLWQYTVPDSMEWQRSGDLGDHDEKHAGQGTSRQDRVGSSLLEGSRAHPNGSLEATEGAEQQDGTSSQKKQKRSNKWTLALEAHLVKALWKPLRIRWS